MCIILLKTSFKYTILQGLRIFQNLTKIFTCKKAKLKVYDGIHSDIRTTVLQKITNAYRKPNDTKTILNFHAVYLCIWKSGLIKCFHNRAFIACNNWLTFHEESARIPGTINAKLIPN